MLLVIGRLRLVEPRSFLVTVDKSNGERLGLDLESDDGLTWIVEAINGGLAAEWTALNI